ncbi:MAG: PQQ-binding-like beta-propeller repeat protein [Actinomycetota bacterium]
MRTPTSPASPPIRDAACPDTGTAATCTRRRSGPSARYLAGVALGVIAVWSLVFAVPAAPVLAADGGAGPWPQFGRDATHAAASPFDSPAPPFHRSWKFRMPRGERALTYPVVSGTTAIAAGTHGVYGVDVATGEQRWRVPRDGGSVAATPAVADVGGTPILVFTQGATAAKSQVLAFSLADPGAPKPLWQVPLQDRTASGVSADGDTAFVGDASGNVVAIGLVNEVRHADPGLIRWQTTVPGVVDTPPAAAGGRVVVAARSRTSGQVEVASLDEETGKISWHYAPSTPVSFASAVTIAGDLALVGSYGDNMLVALSVDDGSKVWSTRLPSQFSPYDDIAVAGGYAFPMPAQAPSESGLYRIRASTGTVATPWNYGTGGLWSFEFDVSALYASPVVVGETVVVGLDDGRLAAIDVSSGVLVWRTDTGDGPVHGIAAADGTIVVSIGSRKGGLIGLVNDPSGSLLSEVSSSKPNWGRMLLDYALAFALVGAAAALLAVVLRTRRRPGGLPVADAGEHPEGEPA